MLEGDVQRSGSQIRVTAKLIDAEADTHLWAERFAGGSDDLFALQDEITSRIAAALDLELVNAEASRPTERPDTRDYIFRGRAERLKPPSRENRAEAIRLFEEALLLDPNSAVAQSWLAIALTARALDLMAETASADITRAEQLAEQASAALPRSTTAHFAKAQVLRAQHRYSEAAPEYETVIALNRNWAHAYSHLGWAQIYDRGDRGAGSSPGERHPAQSSRSSDRIVLQPDRIGASAAITRRRSDSLVRTRPQRRSGAPGISRISRGGLRSEGRC